MPHQPGMLPVECGQCGAHFQVDPAGDIAGAACSECGGDRLFRSQPSATQSDGALRNMVDMQVGGKDRGGNPLGEGIMARTAGMCPHCGIPTSNGINCINCGGSLQHDPIDTNFGKGIADAPDSQGVIMGTDGERPLEKRDNYMHSKVAAPPNMMYEETSIPNGMLLQEYNQTRQKKKCPGCGMPFNAFEGDNSPFCSRCTSDQMKNPELMTPPGTQRVMGTLNMEPYAPLWDESYLPAKTAGPLAALPEMLPEAGGAMGAIGSGLRAIMPKAIGHLMSGIFGGGGGGQQAGGMAPQGPDPAPSMGMLSAADIPFVLVADMDTPQSVKSVDEQHDDPEDQDQKEFNDGDKDPSNFKNPNNDDSGSNGEDGVKDATPGYGFGEQSPALERAMMILPLLLHHFESGDGHSDPLIRGLHDALENENPGYLDNPDPEGEKYVQIILQNHKQPHGVHAGVNAFPSGLPEVPSTGSGMQAPGQGGGQCKMCGGTLAGDGSCPQCGAKPNPQGGMQQGGNEPQTGGLSYPPSQMLARQGNGQGPVTEEQKQVLRQAIDDKPYLFGDVLNQIQNQPNAPPLVDPSQAQPTPAPMSPMQGAPGSMPVNDPSQMGGGGGQPMQPMAKTADANNHVPRCPQCHSASTTVHAVGDNTGDGSGVSSGICHACENIFDITKTADVNALVPRCPRCHSGSTTIKDGLEGESQYKGYCHACEKTFGLNDEKESRVILADLINPSTLDAAEQHSVRPEDGQDPSLVWQDKSGQPVQEGQVYDLYTPGIPEPDVVKVLHKKPDQLELKLVGEFSNIPGTEGAADIVLNPQEMQSKGYSLVPSGGPEGGQDGGEQPLGGMPGLEQIPQSPPTTDETNNSYPNPGTMSHLVVANEVEDDEDLCHKCGYTHIVHTASTPTTTMHECYRCSTTWETQDEDQGRQASVALEWLYGDSPNDSFHAEMERAQGMREHGGQSRSLSAVAAKDERLQTIKERLDHNALTREAGRHFTPKEQRDLVNERGTARNADLLDLSNTHYETRYDASGKANGWNAPDEHLILGL